VASVKPVHWYHFFCGGDVPSLWDEPLGEHVSALRAAAFDGECRIGLVGGKAQQQDARAWLAAYWPEAEVVTVAVHGFEQVTLTRLHEWSGTADETTPVLYCHSKGSFRVADYTREWRRAMTAACVSRWRQCTAALENADAVGLHWLTADAFPGYIDVPFFGGNFWWATAGYLASLTPVEADDVNRYDAEKWIGTGNPRVKALSTVWPEYAGCTFPPP
jgi:hypothetical protein